MQMRTLGNSGPEVSAIGLGCMGMNYRRGPAPAKNEMIALIRAQRFTANAVVSAERGYFQQIPA